MKPPTHILPYVKSISENDTSIVSCTIACSCGGNKFQILYPGSTHDYQGKKIPCTLQLCDDFFFLIKAKCIECKSEILLFDKDYHGWDGYICHDENDALKPRPPLTPWSCAECGELVHSVEVRFCYGDLDRMLEDLRDFRIENLADAFEWIYVDIKCINCEKVTEKWVDYETA